jgi:hypothetical protein
MSIHAIRPSTLLLLLPLLAAGCAHRPVPLPPVPAEETTVEAFPHALGWTLSSGADLRASDGEPLPAPRPFTRVEVIGVDSLGLRVRCEGCGGVEAYADPERLLFEAPPPGVAAWGTLEEFALAIRDAAARRDLESLRPVMSPEFSHGFIGVQTPESAFATWIAEDFATLDAVPALLDGGLASRDGRIWSAPPAFVEELGFRGLRIGFRQSGGRWEWIYLIRGVSG